MAGKEKELEERLREVGNQLGSPPSSVDELLPLLDKTETFLARVDQSPSQSMSNALCPVMTALVAKELLEHSDIDVKVAVASCISEITRVTAPDAPYDDDLMKDAFQRIVEAFEKLDDMSSRSYPKRVSILETVAKVRSCVVMLDLECDNLILDMFQHFLQTTSLRHAENVWSSMETIMTLVIEESEDISQELASCLLDSVKKDREDELPMSFKLGEKVISNCAVKLKPALMELVDNTSLDKYSKVVTSVCLGRSDLVEQNDLNASEKDMADDSKQSERTVSDELPQGSAQLDQEVGCPEVATGQNKSRATTMSNGTVAVGNGASMADKTPKWIPGRSRRTGQSKTAVAAKEDDSDNIESVAMSDPSTKTKGRNRANASGQLAETVDHSKDNNENATVVSGRRKGLGKGTVSAHADGPSGNNIGPTSVDLNLKNETEHHFGFDNGDLDVASGHARTGADPARPKRGRRPRPKSSIRKDADNMAVDQRSPRVAKRVVGNSGSQGSGSRKDLDGIGDSEGKSLRRSSKKDNMKLLGETVNTLTSDLEPKAQGSADKTGPTRKAAEESRSKRQQKSNIKPQKEKEDPQKEKEDDADAAADLSLKEMVSPKSAVKTLGKNKSNLDEGGGSKRKLSSGTEEIPSPKRHKQLKYNDESIVDARIRVWWPDDKMFYSGVVDSFDPASKRHKIIYDDGDVEILLLENEVWEFMEGGGKVDEGRAKELPSLVAAADEMSKSKKTETSLGDAVEIDTPQSGKELTSTPENPSKPKGKPKGQRPKVIVSNNPEGRSKSEGKAVVKVEEETPKTVSTLKREAGSLSNDSTLISGSIPVTKSKESIPKRGSLSKDDLHKPGRKPRADSQSISKLRDGMQSARKNAKKDAAKVGSSEDTPRVRSKSKGIGDESKPNVSSEKGKLKVLESSGSGKAADTGSAKASEPEASTGKKRRRKSLLG